MSGTRAVNRRDFLKGATVTGAAALVPNAAVGATAQAPPPAAAQSSRPATAPVAARETDPDPRREGRLGREQPPR